MTVGSKSAEAALDVVADGANVGLTDEEYILYKLALSVVDQPTKNGKMGSYTQDEAEDALDLLGFDVELAAYLWQSTNAGWNERNNPYR